MLSQLTAVFAFLAFASTTHSLTYVGCFGSPTNLEFSSHRVFQSVGACRQSCTASNFPVMGLTNGTDCLCGASAPPFSNVVEESWCNSRCTGYAQDICGGRGFFSIFLLVEPEDPEEPSSESSTQSVASIETGVAIPQASATNSELLLPGSGE
ncbi:WSC domain-containing protein, partial [Hypoxylon sp. FL1857]